MQFYPVINSSSIDQNYVLPDKNQKQKKIRIPFKPDEDELLKKLVEEFGDKDWSIIASHMNGRTIRQCRERWQNNLSSTVVKSKWTREEDKILRIKYNEFGPKWKLLEEFFPGRTSYNIRNRWNGLTRTKKKSINRTKTNSVACPIKNNYSYNKKINLQSVQKILSYDISNNVNLDRSFSTQKFIIPLISNIPENNTNITNQTNKTKETSKNTESYLMKFDEDQSETDYFTDTIGAPFFTCDDSIFYDKDNLSCF